MKQTIIILLLVFLCKINAQVEIPDPPPPEERHIIKHIDSDLIFISEDMKKNEQTYLKKLNNEIRVQLQSIKELDEEEYYDMLRDAYFSSLEHFFGRDKEETQVMELEHAINELDMKSKIIGIKYQKDKNADRDKLEKELRPILEKLFDKKEQQRVFEIKRIEKELAELKEGIQVRKNHKQEIVNQRLQELLGKDKYLDWD